MGNLISKIWVFEDDADRDSTGTNDGLLVEQRGWNRSRDEWEYCVQAFPTSSVWASTVDVTTLPPTNQDCYYGSSTVSPCYFATTWTGVHTQFGTITNHIENGITRSNSTFTIERAGFYVFAADSVLRLVDDHFALRWRSHTTSTKIQQAGAYGSLPFQTGPFSPSNRGPHSILGVVQVAPGEKFELEYVLNGTGSNATWSGANLDGETTQTLNISIFSVGGTFSLSPVGVKTNNYIAKQGENVLYNPTGGGFTIDFPATPITGGTVSVKNVSTSTNTVTLDGNGNNIEQPTAGYTLSSTVNVTDAGFAGNWQFDGANWLLMSKK